MTANFDKDRFREAMGDMSVIDLANRLGCPKSSISMYLNGQREPSKMAVQLISLVLGVNPAWLCGLDVDKYSNAKIVSVEKAPAISGERKELSDLIQDLPDDIVHALLALAKQAELRR